MDATVAGRSRFGFFLEHDRGTERPVEYAAKLAAYDRYRNSGDSTREYDGFPALLVVTTSDVAEARFAYQAYLHEHRHGPAALPAFLATTGADLARTKHDRRDALQLAEMLRIGYFTETKRLPPAYAALRRAFHEHVRLADARAQQQILIRHALEGVFPELRRACRAAVQKPECPAIYLNWSSWRSNTRA